MLPSQRHPSDIPSLPTNVLYDRTWQETGRDTALQLPGSEELEECSRNQDTPRQADPHRKRRSCAQQDNGDHEAKPAAGESNPEEERELPGRLEGPETSQEHYIEISSSAHADAVTEASASSNTCNGAPALSQHKQLRNCQRTPSGKGKLPVVSYKFSDLDSGDEEVTANESEEDNCQIYFDVDSGSSNDPGSPKTASLSW